jgi:hypothetical protein
LDYELGEEEGAGAEGNASMLLHPFLPLAVAAAVIFSVPVVAGFFLNPFSMSFNLIELLVWLLITIILGLLLQVFLQAVQRARYRRPFHNSELRSLVDQAARCIEYEDDVEIWMCPGEKQILLGLSAVLFRSVIISQPTAQDILDRPEEGEAVLADVLVKLRKNRILSTWAPISLVVVGSLLDVYYYYTPLSFKIALACASIVGFILIQGAIIRPGPTRKKDLILQQYGVHPDVARVTVFKGSQLSLAEEEIIIKRKQNPMEDPEKRKNTWGAYFASLGVSAIVATLLYLLMFQDAPSFFIAMGLDVFIPLMVFLMTFEILFIGYDLRYNNGR